MTTFSPRMRIFLAVIFAAAIYVQVGAVVRALGKSKTTVFGGVTGCTSPSQKYIDAIMDQYSCDKDGKLKLDLDSDMKVEDFNKDASDGEKKKITAVVEKGKTELATLMTKTFADKAKCETAVEDVRKALETAAKDAK